MCNPYALFVYLFILHGIGFRGKYMIQFGTLTSDASRNFDPIITNENPRVMQHWQNDFIFLTSSLVIHYGEIF